MPLIAAGIGAVAKTGGAWLGGKAQKKGAKKAAKAQAKQSAGASALSKAIYGDTKGMYAPSAVQGQMAGNTLMALLGLGGGGTPAAPGGSALAAYQPPTPQEELEFLLKGSADVIGPKRTKKILKHGGSPEEQLRYAQSLLKPGERAQYDAWQISNEPSIYEAAGLGANGMGTEVDPAAAAKSALDTFKSSTNYNFLYDEGARGVNNQWAGDFESGAAARAMSDYGQNTAHANAIGPYMQMLAQQQGVGLNSVGGIANAGNLMYGQQQEQGQLATDAKAAQYAAVANAKSNLYGTAADSIAGVANAAFGGMGGGAQAGTGAAGSSYTPSYSSGYAAAPYSNPVVPSQGWSPYTKTLR